MTVGIRFHSKRDERLSHRDLIAELVLYEEARDSRQGFFVLVPANIARQQWHIVEPGDALINGVAEHYALSHAVG